LPKSQFDDQNEGGSEDEITENGYYFDCISREKIPKKDKA